MENLVEKLLTPGSTPNIVIRIVNGSCVLLLVVLGVLTSNNVFEEDQDGGISLNFHLYMMMILAVCLMVCVNWFASELKNAKKQSVGDKIEGSSGAPLKTD